MLFVSAAHSFLRLIITLLVLKNVFAGSRARQIERRSLYFGSHSALSAPRPQLHSQQQQYQLQQQFPGIEYANIAASLTPTVFSHQVYHSGDYDQQLPPRSLGSGALIPISYGSQGTGAPYYYGGVGGGVLSNGPSHNLVEEDVEPYYYHGERILKQYLVMEKSKHDLLIDSHLGNPFQPPPILRYETRRLPFGGIVDVPIFDTNNLEPRLHPFKPNSLRKNHGLTALGSGSLGLISLPNGNVYLGSGSLGYVSEKQHVDTLVQPTQRPFLVASPVQFGTNEN